MTDKETQEVENKIKGSNTVVNSEDGKETVSTKPTADHNPGHHTDKDGAKGGPAVRNGLESEA